MKFGLWIEPERIPKTAKLFKEKDKTMKHITLLGTAVCIVVVAQADQSLAADGFEQQKAHNLERNGKVTMKYLLYLPKDYDQKQAWPLMLYLHGSGYRGDDLELVKKSGPQKLIEGGKQFPFIVVAPQCSKGRQWEPRELAALLDEIVTECKVDQDRVYLSGASMGAFGAWSLIAYQPNRFAAIAPVCGGGDPMAVKPHAHVPAWVFHGDKDPIVPLARSEAMVEALKKNGGNVTFTVYPDAGHDVGTRTFADPKLYEWLLQQKRAEK